MEMSMETEYKKDIENEGIVIIKEENKVNAKSIDLVRADV